MNLFRHPFARSLTVVVILALVTAACTDGSTESTETSDPSDPVMVAPNTEQPSLVVSVAVSEAGFEPKTIFLPAGRHVRLTVRNHSDVERHYRIVGLIPAQLGWQVRPVISDDMLDALTPEELEELGISGEDMSNREHALHHLSPTFLSYKPESRSGIRPLPNEVHAYVYKGVADIVTFYPLSVGKFVVEDPLHPEITGKVVVFDPGT